MSNHLSFDYYQDAARETAVYPAQVGLAYTALGLAGEAGEVADKIKKVFRDNDGVLTLEKSKEIAKELGDVLWYAANLAHELGMGLGDIAAANLDKLRDRQARGVLKGSGDNR